TGVSTTLPRAPIPTLLSRRARRPNCSTAASTSAALRLVADIRDERRRLATLFVDHRDGLLGGFAGNVDDEDPDAGPPQSQCGGAAIADAVIGGAAAGDDRDLADEVEIVGRRLQIAHRILAWLAARRYDAGWTSANAVASCMARLKITIVFDSGARLGPG